MGRRLFSTLSVNARTKWKSADASDDKAFTASDGTHQLLELRPQLRNLSDPDAKGIDLPVSPIIPVRTPFPSGDGALNSSEFPGRGHLHHRDRPGRSLLACPSHAATYQTPQNNRPTRRRISANLGSARSGSRFGATRRYITS